MKDVDVTGNAGIEEVPLRHLHRFHVAVHETAGPRRWLPPAVARLCWLLHFSDDFLPGDLRGGDYRPLKDPWRGR